MGTKPAVKKVWALLLVCSMILSLCSCNAFSKKEVLAAAKEVAENIENFDSDRLLELSNLNKNGDKANELRKGLNGDYLDENTLKFCMAVRNTISYEVREYTFSAKKDEATVDIDFSMVDYKALLRKEYNDIDELVSAVKKSDDTIHVVYNARFVKEDGRWLLDNLMGSSFLSVFDFMNADIGALAVDLSKIVKEKSCSWLGAVDGAYINARKLQLVVEFNTEVTKLRGKSVNMTYTVSKDGKDVWKSDYIALGTKTKMQLDYGTDQNPSAELKSGYLAEGVYMFTLAADNGTVLYSSSVKTRITIKETTVTTGTSSKGYLFYDSTFASKVLLAEWVPIDNKRVNAVSYGSDALAISFQMKMDPSMTENLYFKYFYAANVSDALKIKVKTDNASISGVAKPIVNANGTFFALGLKTKTSFKPGIYILAMFSEDQSKLYGLAECQILSKPAADYNTQP